MQSGDSFTSIAKKFNTSVSVVAELNDFDKDKVLFVGERIWVPIASDKTMTQPTTVSKVIQKPTVTTVKTAGVTTTVTLEPAATKTSTSNTFTYVVQPNDTLIGVANKFDLHTADLAKLNNLEITAMLNIGQKLQIPSSVDRLKVLAKEKSNSVAKSSTKVIQANKTTVTTVANNLPKVNIVSYTVQSGDSLSGLARRYNTTNADLARMNKIGATDQLLIGQKILVPVQSKTSVTVKAVPEKY